MSLSRHHLIGLMDPPREGNLQTSQWMQQVTSMVRQGMGMQGDSQAKWLTWQDLETNHIVQPLPGGGYAPGDGTEPPDMSPPPALLNLEARGGMTAIRVLWDNPDLNYDYRVEVHKSATDDLGEAYLVGTSQGTIFEDVVGSDTTTWYYWVRVAKTVNNQVIVGPWNKTEGTPAAAAPDPDWILKDLEGKIDDSHLNDLLSGEIDKIPRLEIDLSELEVGLNTEITERKDEDTQLHSRIDTNVSRIDDNTAAIIKESETRATEDEALARQIETLAVEVGDNTAAIQTESEVRATEDAALATRITQLQVEVDGEFAGIRDEMTVIIDDQEKLAQRVGTVELDLEDTKGAIEQQFKVFEDEFENIRAEYTVKLDVDGYVGGFGLVNDGDVITALWRVDVFGVGAPGCETLAFAVDATTDPPIVAMNGASIVHGSLGTAQIGELDVDRLVGGTADWVEANIRDASITNAKIGNVIQSNNYEAGKSGWLLNKAGFLECFQIFARGKIDGSIIRGSVIEGGMLIQSDIQITTPTEADLGPGTIRYLSVVTTSEQVADYTNESGGSSAEKTRLLPIATANYTAEGHQEYGDGDVKEPVYINFNRYLKYQVKPWVFARFSLSFYQDNRYIDFRFTLFGIHLDNSETVVYQGSRETARYPYPTLFPGWYHGTMTGGEWSIYIHERTDCQDSSCRYTYAVTKAVVTYDKLSYGFDSSQYKGLKARFESWSRSGVTTRVKEILIKDTLSDYL